MTRWQELNNEGVRLLQVGDFAGAQAAFEACLESDVDDEARAASLVNLSAVVDMTGDPGRAVDLLAEAAGLTSAQRAVVLSSRAEILTRLGRWAEARADAQDALDLAYQEVPSLAPAIHMMLAEIIGSTGDLVGSAEHWGLARELSVAMGDRPSEAAALLSLARLAYLASDYDRADALYDEASDVLRANENQRGHAVCLHGRAAVLASRGQAREALSMLDQVVDVLTAPTERVAVHQVQGGAWEALGEFGRAESCYGLAMAASEQAGLWHITMGIAWWRADALVRWALSVTGEQRRELSRRALDFALPAALAAEAVRQRFPHGPMRERWVALASAPLIHSAFNAIRAVGDVDLVAAYIDHITSTVSFDGAAQVARDELVSLPLPPPVEETHLPYAASFLASTGLSSVGFALPPRVRVDPTVPSALDTWIDVAERRYGLPVRSARVVRSW